MLLGKEDEWQHSFRSTSYKVRSTSYSVLVLTTEYLYFNGVRTLHSILCTRCEPRDGPSAEPQPRLGTVGQGLQRQVHAPAGITGTRPQSTLYPVLSTSTDTGLQECQMETAEGCAGTLRLCAADLRQGDS